MVNAKVIYEHEAVGLIENLSDAQMRALPEFLRSYSYFSKLVEKNLQPEDV